MKEIQQAPRQAAQRDAAQAALRALFDDELVLRQRANGLYADAASLSSSVAGPAAAATWPS